ncbi:MAG: lytic transglycosylase domain-containing protein [Betaproteobacteria bacterium]|nr:lytic transglycosylase domain-containing protein [Betaproteobacteria bacterium]
MKAHLIGMCCLCAAALPGPCRADVYAYTDSQGIIHYTNRPNHRAQHMRLVLRTPPALPLPETPPAPAFAGKPGHYAGLIRKSSAACGIDPALVKAMIVAESGDNPQAVSPRGAIGLMQLMPATARRYGAFDPFNPAENIQAGTEYLRDLLTRFNQNLALALAAYNAGAKAVIKYGYSIPPYPETEAYVPKVLRLYRAYKRNS